MIKKFLRSHLTILFACFCVCSLFVLTLQKTGKTAAVRASADAIAYKVKERWFWTTFKAEAYAGVSAPKGAIGVYQLEVEVTDKIPKRTGPKAFSSGVKKEFKRNIADHKTYRAWGSGSDVRFSASSKAEITSDAGDDADDAHDQYPPR